MKLLHLQPAILLVAGIAVLVGCGGGVFGTSKTWIDPLGLQGRSANMSTQVTVDGLTTHLAADQQNALRFTLNDQTTTGNPYEGMSTMEISQQVSLLFSIEAAGTLPTTFTLRDVDLRVVVRTSEGSSRTSPPIEFRYTGFLTLDRQADGSYKARESLLLRSELDRFDGSSLIAILIAGGANTVTSDVSFTADTSSPNIPSGSTVSFTLQFGNSNAVVRW